MLRIQSDALVLTPAMWGLVRSSTPAQQTECIASAINSVIRGSEFRFAPPHPDEFYRVENSLLSCVLRRKTGLQISLGAVCCVIAHAVGLPRAVLLLVRRRVVC